VAIFFVADLLIFEESKYDKKVPFLLLFVAFLFLTDKSL